MNDSDQELLSRYARHDAQDAFAELVRRRVALVYSAALRQVRSPQLAKEVSQTVFLKLARQAGRLQPDTLLSAWLYQVTRHTAVDAIRHEARRQQREHIASEIHAMNAPDAEWATIGSSNSILCCRAPYADQDRDRVTPSGRIHPAAKAALTFMTIPAPRNRKLTGRRADGSEAATDDGRPPRSDGAQ